MREELGIDDWLELVKEDKNLNGAYISLAQYMYLLEKENRKYKEVIDKIQEKFKDWKNGIEKERKYYLCERDCAFRLKESKKYLYK